MTSVVRAGVETDMRKPAARVVRLVALALLDDARHAVRQFRKGDGTDPELLHDFRVSTRRLRSWLQLWRAVLADSLFRSEKGAVLTRLSAAIVYKPVLTRPQTIATRPPISSSTVANA